MFAAALRALGFSVTNLAGRVRWMAPPERPDGARNHMLLRVDLADGPWLADVGFGGHLFAAPIRLEPRIEQQTPAGAMRLVPFGESPDPAGPVPRAAGRTLYRFNDEVQSQADYEVFSWHTSAHPTSLFRSLLIAERLTPERRISLVNTRLTERFTDGRVVERVLDSTQPPWRGCWTKTSGLTPPAEAAVIYQRLPKG